MKRLSFIFVFLLTFTSHCFSQGNVRFTYDASGNRISRTIVSGMNAKGGFFLEETSSVNNVFAEPVSFYVQTSSKHGVYSLILSPDLIGSKLVVYNSKGMKVLEETIKTETTYLDLTTYPRDIYLLSISSENHTYTRKLISKK